MNLSKPIQRRFRYLELIELEYNNVFLAPAESAGADFAEIEKAYRQGYLDRPDRKEKSRWGENTEIFAQFESRRMCRVS